MGTEPLEVKTVDRVFEKLLLVHNKRISRVNKRDGKKFEYHYSINRGDTTQVTRQSRDERYSQRQGRESLTRNESYRPGSQEPTTSRFGRPIRSKNTSALYVEDEPIKKQEMAQFKLQIDLNSHSLK